MELKACALGGGRIVPSTKTRTKKMKKTVTGVFFEFWYLKSLWILQPTDYTAIMRYRIWMGLRSQQGKVMTYSHGTQKDAKSFVTPMIVVVQHSARSDTRVETYIRRQRDWYPLMLWGGWMHSILNRFDIRFGRTRCQKFIPRWSDHVTIPFYPLQLSTGILNRVTIWVCFWF